MCLSFENFKEAIAFGIRKPLPIPSGAIDAIHFLHCVDATKSVVNSLDPSIKIKRIDADQALAIVGSVGLEQAKKDILKLIKLEHK